MKCIFEKKFLKNDEGGLCCFLGQNFRKKAKGGPFFKKTKGEKTGTKRWPLADFFEKKFKRFIDILVVSTLESNADSKSVVRLS